MTNYQLKIYPEECLRRISEDVTRFDINLRQTVNAMKDIMGRAVGLAAPQVGLNQNIIIMNFQKYFVLVNPVVKLYGKNLFTYPEMCLSVPGETVLIKRPDYVEVDYQDLKGNSCNIEWQYFYAQACQHELDHLQGKLIIDYKEKPEEPKDDAGTQNR